MHKGQHPDCAMCSRYQQDVAFLEQVKSLMRTACSARDEAEEYAKDIVDPLLWKQASEELKKS